MAHARVVRTSLAATAAVVPLASLPHRATKRKRALTVVIRQMFLREVHENTLKVNIAAHRR